MTQYETNKKYNNFLFQIILWSYLYKKIEADREKGSSPIENYEKMISFQEIAQAMLPEIEKFNRSKIRSSYPLVDDITLIQIFKDTYRV